MEEADVALVSIPYANSLRAFDSLGNACAIASGTYIATVEVWPEQDTPLLALRPNPIYVSADGSLPAATIFVPFGPNQLELRHKKLHPDIYIEHFIKQTAKTA